MSRIVVRESAAKPDLEPREKSDPALLFHSSVHQFSPMILEKKSDQVLRLLQRLVDVGRVYLEAIFVDRK